MTTGEEFPELDEILKEHDGYEYEILSDSQPIKMKMATIRQDDVERMRHEIEDLLHLVWEKDEQICSLKKKLKAIETMAKVT